MDVFLKWPDIERIDNTTLNIDTVLHVHLKTERKARLYVDSQIWSFLPHLFAKWARGHNGS